MLALQFGQPGLAFAALSGFSQRISLPIERSVCPRAAPQCRLVEVFHCVIPAMAIERVLAARIETILRHVAKTPLVETTGDAHRLRSERGKVLGIGHVER